MKTRLAADVGPQRAVEIYEILLRTTLLNLPPSETHDRWLAFDPAEMEDEFGNWLSVQVPEFQNFSMHAQPAGGLGERLWALTAEAFSTGAKMVTLIGTDCPWLRNEHFTAVEAALEQGADIVFGPAADGGFYLQSITLPHRELFTDIPWSTAETLAACEAKAAALGLKVARLETLSDIDTLADWQTNLMRP